MAIRFGGDGGGGTTPKKPTPIIYDPFRNPYQNPMVQAQPAPVYKQPVVQQGSWLGQPNYTQLPANYKQPTYNVPPPRAPVDVNKLLAGIHPTIQDVINESYPTNFYQNIAEAYNPVMGQPRPPKTRVGMLQQQAQKNNYGWSVPPTWLSSYPGRPTGFGPFGTSNSPATVDSMPEPIEDQGDGGNYGWWGGGGGGGGGYGGSDYVTPWYQKLVNWRI